MTSTAVAEDDPDAFPRPFGPYLLLENFARGGMGEVYLAKSGAIAGLEKYCVLKKLRSELTRDREYVTRFIDEARVVVTLQHANICHVFDVGRVGDEYYLAMEYVSGRDVRTLQDRCRTREKPMPPASALQIVCEILEALDYAHRRSHPISGEPLKLVHRDVSPQNVLVSYEGEVKLIDFGLAASRLKVERTQPNVVMGKMAYMAPEQARGDPIDARADLFACGVMLYELIAGERFYEGMTANDIWQVAGKGGFTPRKWEQIDRDLAKHIAKALAPDPKKRFATCGDFRDALSSHLHWRFPGSGVRGLREMMAEVFASELQREREMLAKFGKVTVARFQTEFEESRSQSVSLARADETSPTVVKKGAQLVRDEQSQSSGAVMPPPQTVPDRAELPVGQRDVHQDPTRLVVSSKNQATQIVREKSLDRPPAPTLENAPVDVRTRVNEGRDTTEDHPKERELTMRVARARGPSGPIEDRAPLATDRPASKSRPLLFVAVAALTVVVIVAVIAHLNATPPVEPKPPAPVPVPVAMTPPPPPAPIIAPPPPPAPVVAPPLSTTHADAVAEPDEAKPEPNAKPHGKHTADKAKKIEKAEAKPDKAEHATTAAQTSAPKADVKPAAAVTTPKPDAKPPAPNPEAMGDDELLKAGRNAGCPTGAFQAVKGVPGPGYDASRGELARCVKRSQQ